MLEAPVLVAGLDDFAVMREAIKQRGYHCGVTEDGGPFSEGEVGGDDDGGSLVEAAYQVEEELASGLGEGQIAQLVEDELRPVSWSAGQSDRRFVSAHKAQPLSASGPATTGYPLGGATITS